MTWLETLSVVIALLLAVAWYLSYSASRLDRLHARAEGALSALDAQLVRRAEASLELANSADLDPVSSLIVASAASDALERQTESALDDDPLDGQHFAQRESVESDLSSALDVALSPEVVAALREQDGIGQAALQRVVAASRRVQFARRFLNNAVTDVQRVRGKWVVRTFRLAGHAALPHTVEFDDELPASLR